MISPQWWIWLESTVCVTWNDIDKFDFFLISFCWETCSSRIQNKEIWILVQNILQRLCHLPIAAVSTVPLDCWKMLLLTSDNFLFVCSLHRKSTHTTRMMDSSPPPNDFNHKNYNFGPQSKSTRGDVPRKELFDNNIQDAPIVIAMFLLGVATWFLLDCHC